MPTLTETRDALAEALETVSGIQKVFARMPRALQDAELPALVIVAGECQYGDDYGQGNQSRTRLWQVQLFAMNGGQGREMAAEAKAEALLDPVADALSQMSAVVLDDGTAFTVQLRRDSGIVRLKLGEPEYAGVVYTIQTEDEGYFPEESF